MEIARSLKIIIQKNKTMFRLFDFFTKTALYRLILRFKIREHIEYIKNNSSYGISIETSNLCNAKCTFCPHPIMKRKKEVMSDQVFNKIIEQIKKAGIKPYSFGMNGFGEPLTDKKIFDRINTIKKEFPGTPVKFHTNFGLANDEVIKSIFSSHIDEINISFNGYNKAAYESIMGIDYDKTLDNVMKLIEMKKNVNSNLKIRISLAMETLNLADVDLFVEKWSKLVDSVTVNKISSWGGAIKTATNNVFRTEFPCLTLWNTIPILVNGDVGLCCAAYENKHNLGNILKTDLMSIFYSEKFETIRKAHLKGKRKSIPVCDQCYLGSNGIEWFFKNLY